MLRKAIVFVGLSLFAVTGYGYIDSGNELLIDCQSEVIISNNNYYGNIADWSRAGYCIGYIDAIVGNFDQIYFCVPGTNTLDQSARIIVKYLHNNPEKLSLFPTDVVKEALANTFPCSKKID